ncbi:MAG: DUF3135 domain-containing protein [Psychromonas sp.]|nr:DUF3135 domain-containing protein [Psychromonas sp.]
MDNNASPELDTLPDFDTLKDLFEHSPEKVELILRTNIEKIFANASEKNLRRLQGLQFQIDAQRRLSKNPIDACIRISRMMNDSFIELNTVLNDFVEKQ